MARSTHQGARPLLLLIVGLIGLQATSALGQDTLYTGSAGGSVEINLDVLDQLGTSQTIPQMLRTDIRRGHLAAGTALPLPGETPATVTRGLPLPPPSRPAHTQSRRSVAAGSTALPVARVQRPPTLPAVRSTTVTAARVSPPPAPSTPRTTGPSAVPAPARVAASAPSAPRVARMPAPVVAPPARVAITAPEPKSVHAAPKVSADATDKAKTTLPDIVIPAAPKTAARAPTIVPPPPPAITSPAMNASTPPAQSAEPARQIASASPASKAGQSPPKPSRAGAAISIAFATDTKSLPTDADGLLDQVVEKMNAHKSMRVQLLAFASAEERSEAKARRLSLSRALEVRSYLIRKGVASTRIDVRALGNQVPSGSPDRVDLTIVSR